MDIPIYIQLIAALVVVIILYVITLLILRSDSLMASPDNKVYPNESIKIVDGYGTVAQLANMKFNTYNPDAKNFKMIPRSLDSRGGASFTYQFWIKIKDTNDALYNNQVILLKGDKRLYQTGLYNSNNQLASSTQPDYAIKSPLIKFGSSYRELVVQFNTNKVPNYSVDIAMNPSDTNGSPHRNVLSLLPLNWFLFTFVFEDSYSLLDSSANGVKMTFYVNDFPYEVVSANTDPLLKNNTLVQNDGELYLFPDLKSVGDFVDIADVGYFSSALNANDIRKTFQKGPTLTPMKQENIPKMVPDVLSAFNKLDIYNY